MALLFACSFYTKSPLTFDIFSTITVLKILRISSHSMSARVVTAQCATVALFGAELPPAEVLIRVARIDAAKASKKEREEESAGRNFARHIIWQQRTCGAVLSSYELLETEIRRTRRASRCGLSLKRESSGRSV